MSEYLISFDLDEGTRTETVNGWTIKLTPKTVCEITRCRDCLNCLQTTPKRSHEKTARAYAYACAKRPSETWRQINEELNAMGIGYKSAEGLRVAFCKAKKSHTSLQCSKFSHKVEPDGFCKWASRRDA